MGQLLGIQEYSKYIKNFCVEVLGTYSYHRAAKG